MLNLLIITTKLDRRCKHLWAIIMCTFLGVAFCHAEDNKPENLTTVYKTIGTDGKITFSDQPIKNSETLIVPPVPSIPALSPIQNSVAPKTSDYDDQQARYTSLSILSPANDAAFYSGSGEVDVVLDIQPSLIVGDKVQLFLDNTLIQEAKSLQAKLQSTSRGTHQLTAKIISSSGKILKEKTSTFTVHRPSIGK